MVVTQVASGRCCSTLIVRPRASGGAQGPIVLNSAIGKADTAERMQQVAANLPHMECRRLFPNPIDADLKSNFATGPTRLRPSFAGVRHATSSFETAGAAFHHVLIFQGVRSLRGPPQHRNLWGV